MFLTFCLQVNIFGISDYGHKISLVVEEAARIEVFCIWTLRNHLSTNYTQNQEGYPALECHLTYVFLFIPIH